MNELKQQKPNAKDMCFPTKLFNSEKNIIHIMETEENYLERSHCHRDLAFLLAFLKFTSWNVLVLSFCA